MTGSEYFVLAGILGPPELLWVLLALVVLFGAKKIPVLARALGRSLNEFKKGKDEGAKDESPDEPADKQNADEGKGKS